MNETILICGANRLGEAVMSTPALLRLRAARPAARIVLLTAEPLRDLWNEHPALDDVMTFAGRESVFSVARRLRALRADAALILPGSTRAIPKVWLAKIPRRIGYPQPWCSWMLTEKVPPPSGEAAPNPRSAYEVRLLIETGIEITRPPLPAGAHNIFRHLELTSVLGASKEACAPQIAVAKATASAVRARFGTTAKAGRTRPLIGMNPGAEHRPARCWPAERFVEAATAFQQQRPSDWWIFGGSADRELATGIAVGLRERLGAAANVENLAGATSLAELCAALQTVDVLLTNDTGPMHVAAAVGTPVVGLFGSTSPDLTAPGLPGDPRHQLVREAPACAPCFQPECPVDFRCMNGLSVERVVTALTRVVDESLAKR